MNRRKNLEMSDFQSDRAVALCIWLVTLGILIFTGAGEVMWGQIQSYLATWGM